MAAEKGGMLEAEVVQNWQFITTAITFKSDNHQI